MHGNLLRSIVINSCLWFAMYFGHIPFLRSANNHLHISCSLYPKIKGCLFFKCVRLDLSQCEGHHAVIYVSKTIQWKPNLCFCKQKIMRQRFQSVFVQRQQIMILQYLAICFEQGDDRCGASLFRCYGNTSAASYPRQRTIVMFERLDLCVLANHRFKPSSLRKAAVSYILCR